MLAKLLEDGVLQRGEGWCARECNDKTWRLAVCGRLGRDAHELERRFISALHQTPDKSALELASDVVDGDAGNRLDAPLISAGLLHDESCRSQLTGFAVACSVLGFVWGLVQVRAGSEAIADVLFITSTTMFMAAVLTMPDTFQADVTANGREVVERERKRHAQLSLASAHGELPLAIALHGIDVCDSDAHQGLRYARQLLDAESRKTI